MSTAEQPKISGKASRPPRHAGLLLTVGLHVIDGEQIEVSASEDNPRAREVHMPLAVGRHEIDGKVAIVPSLALIEVWPALDEEDAIALEKILGIEQKGTLAWPPTAA